MTYKQYWKDFKGPLIGLAPMDGYSDSAFRRVCKAVNPNIITYTEFTSADGIHHNPKHVAKRLQFHPSEKPVIAQIFGKDTETFMTAAKFCEDMGFTGIDINMGCPAKKVVKSEHGVALRKNHDLAFKLIESLAKSTALPISVKTRLGWDNADDLIPFSKGAENAGADMICIHARTYKVPYKCPAQWEYLYEMKKEVSIPVLGNGGVVSLADGLAKMQNLDGFLIGQATFGNPWVFSETDEHNLNNKLEDKIPLILNHSKWLIESKGEHVGTREIRKHLLSYVKGFHGAKQFRSELCHVNSLADIEAIFKKIKHAILDYAEKKTCSSLEN